MPIAENGVPGPVKIGRVLLHGLAPKVSVPASQLLNPVP